LRAVCEWVVAIVYNMTGGAPASTLTDLLGAPVAEVTAQDIARLIDGQVRETDELDFKATLYGRDEDAKVELCKDIAGLCNHRGGGILLGVGEKDAVANGRPEVDLSDAEERSVSVKTPSFLLTTPHPTNAESFLPSLRAFETALTSAAVAPAGFVFRYLAIARMSSAVVLTGSATAE